ncbi:MAG: hypothetical protein ACR2HN_14165 [Tepidiformaceae bacterium]
MRRRRPATSIPDLLFAVAAAAWTMAVIFFAASFFDDNVTAGDAGRVLARIFAGSLFVSGLFLGLLGVGLLRDDVRQSDHYVVPLLLGAVIGALESVIFLLPAEELLIAPFALLIFAFRPVRRWVARSLPDQWR